MFLASVTLYRLHLYVSFRRNKGVCELERRDTGSRDSGALRDAKSSVDPIPLPIDTVVVQLSHAHDESRGEDEHHDEGNRGHHHSRRGLAKVDIVEQMAG